MWSRRTILVAACGPAAVLVVLLLLGERARSTLLLATLAAALGNILLLRAGSGDLHRLAGQEAARRDHAGAAQVAALRACLSAEQILVRDLPDPLVLMDANRAVHRINTAAEDAFPLGLASILRHPGFRTAVDRALAQNRRHATEITLPVGRDVSVTVIPLDPPLGDGTRIAAILSDRTRERAVERMRADFVANASHELRTPLASLIGFIETLRGPAATDPPAQARFLAIMAEQADRMNRLIDDLLGLSRIELTEHQPPSGTVDLPSLLQRLADVFEPRIDARAMTLSLDIAPDLSPVPGDEDQLEQVMQNLLDNAVKYGRHGGTVRVTVSPASPGPPWPHRPGIVVSVADDGAGIPRQHIPRLTERFYRADKHRSRAVGGTGLGLAIVKHILNRHRGRLHIDSTEGVGTVVTAWLPVAPAPETAAADAA